MSILRRDIIIGLSADQLFAITTLDNNKIINGGTAWAVYAFIYKHIEYINQNNNNYNFPIGTNGYIYDQIIEKWFQIIINKKDDFIIHDFIEINNSPIIKNSKYIGIGTRELNKKGEEIISNLYR